MNNNLKYILIFIGVFLIGGALIFGYSAIESNDDKSVSSVSTSTMTSINSSVNIADSAQVSESFSIDEGESVVDTVSTKYKDGTYSATQDYTSPAGPGDEVSITVTIENDVIVFLEDSYLAQNPTSDRFQSGFESSVESTVLNESVDEVELDSLSGASLTSEAFNKALLKIKDEAEV